MKKIKTVLFYILSIHILALVFMLVQRLILLFTNFQHLAGIESKFSGICSALLKGLWFDNVIACYISILPLAVLSIAGLCNRIARGLFIGTNVFYIIVYSIVFGIGSADIPYFSYFFRHLNTSVFNWKEESATNAGMVFQETSYYGYFILFIIFVIIFAYFAFRISNRLLSERQENIRGKQYALYIPLCIVLIGLCLFGIRGRVGYNPIKTSEAYFCNNSFMNQLGINPSFFFMRDIIESSKKYYDVDALEPEKKAINYVRAALNIHENIFTSPIARHITTEGKVKNMNIVVILMESMSADLLKVRENGKEITPYLNQLINKSYYFEHFFSAGTHTNHGILASLYGMPSILDRNMMKNVDIPLCEGIPSILKDQGYRTMFFMTHEAQYDNINAFLLENGVEEIYSQENYPSEKRVNSFGVADDFLFEYGINKLNEKAQDNKPFFATLLTISNHPPYIVPEKYESVSSDPQYQIVAFADDAIRQFMEEALKQDWSKNTIFVLLGDHGKIVGSQTYDMPLSYNHIPCIIYSPALEDAPRIFSQFGGQVDLFPTIMGLLNRSYVNNTLGIDLFKEKRPYMFFSSDDALGCIGPDYFYSYNLKSNIEGLFNYKNNNSDNIIDQHRALADSMKTYSASMLRISDYMFKNKLTRVPTKK